MDAAHDYQCRLLLIGPTCIELCSEQDFTDLKNASHFKKTVGGIAAKLAIGCARLGLPTIFMSDCGHDHFGEYIIDRLQSEGIDTSYIKERPHHPTPLNFRAKENQQLEQQLHYTATIPMNTEELDVTPFKLSSAIVLFASNFMHPHYQELSLRALEIAKSLKKKIWLIIDVVKKDPAMHARFETILPHCDLLLGSQAHWLYMTEQHQLQATLQQLRSKTRATFIVFKDETCAYIPAEIATPWDSELNKAKFKDYPTKTHDVAFIAGFLASHIQDMPMEQSIEMGFACQMIALSRADSYDSLASGQELAFFLSSHDQITQNTLHSAYFSHIHYATTQEKRFAPLCLFGLGYHQQWVKSSMTKAKELVAQGIAKVGEFDPSGIILDDKENSTIIEMFPRHKGCMVRPVEVPMSIPLQFNTEIDITSLLHTWPDHHIAKASIIYHTDDRFILREAQEDRLHLLYRACRAQKRPFIVDIVPPSRNLITASTFAHMLKHFYEIGIYADWWQIPHQLNARSYDSIHEIIQENDPYCQGFLLNLTMATSNQLKLLFETIAHHQGCGGFVLGRALIQTALEHWFKEKMSDEALVESVAHQFRKAIQTWEEVLKDRSSELPQEKRA